MSRLKTVLSHALSGLVIWLSCFFSESTQALCSASSFNTYWPDVQAVYFKQLRADQKRSLEMVKLTARGKMIESYWHFNDFLEEFPEFCRLQKMAGTPQQYILFVTLIQRLTVLEDMLDEHKVSANYLIQLATINPVFASNLIIHAEGLSGILNTFDIPLESLKYFDQIASALIKHSGKAKVVFYIAFNHLLLLMSEGWSEQTLDRYTRFVITLPEYRYDDFMKLDSASSSGIHSFMNQAIDSPLFENCVWSMYSKAHKVLFCRGNETGNQTRIVWQNDK